MTDGNNCPDDERKLGGILNINTNKARIWFRGGLVRSIEDIEHLKIDMTIKEVDIRKPIEAGQLCQLQLFIPDLERMIEEAKEYAKK